MKASRVESTLQTRLRFFVSTDPQESPSAEASQEACLLRAEHTSGVQGTREACTQEMSQQESESKVHLPELLSSGSYVTSDAKGVTQEACGLKIPMVPSNFSDTRESHASEETTIEVPVPTVTHKEPVQKATQGADGQTVAFKKTYDTQKDTPEQPSSPLLKDTQINFLSR